MTSKGTILLATNSAWNSYHFRGALIKALKAEGYTIVTVAPDDAYTEKLKTLVDQHIPFILESDGTSPRRDAALLLRYVRILRKIRPVAMLTYTIKPNIYGNLAARLVGVPVISNVSGLGTVFIRRNWLTRIVETLYRSAFKHAACVFFQNPEDRDLFIALKLVVPEKTAVLKGSGVDLAYFKPEAASRDASQPLSFVLIARMLWDKGIGEYVAASRIVKTKHPEVIFHLVGPQGSRNKTAISEAQLAQWNSEGNVTYRGASDEVRRIIAQYDCIVLPSYREGLSRVLLEAAAMGKPLIATDVAGCRQIVENGINGLLCNARDPEHLAERMLHFIALTPERRMALGKASRVKAENEFDEQHVLDAYLEKIRSLLRC